MATPYSQHRIASTSSTQDLAREKKDSLPALVIAASQTEGRGRTGSGWETAPRALAVSMAFDAPDDHRPFSLIAGVAATRAIEGVLLKWPNDLILVEEKVGGILVERSEGVVTVGLGVNLWWPDRPAGYGALYEEDPGADRHAEIGALWGAELMRLVDAAGWPVEEYRALCQTLGREITWQPDGVGRAVGIADDGGLVVETSLGPITIYSGAVRYVR